MSLNIYTRKEDIPEGMQYVDYNDAFFLHVRLSGDPVAAKILYDVDKAKFYNFATFIGRDEGLGPMNKSYLSTGCKTLLNILNNPDVCFNVVECGQNALRLLPYIKNGNIFWELPVCFFAGDIECDINVHGLHFTSYREFMAHMMDKEE